MSKKIASVIVLPDAQGKGVSLADVFCSEEGVISFPCPEDRIGGVFYRKKTRRKTILEASVSLADYFEVLKKKKCKEIIFKNGS